MRPSIATAAALEQILRHLRRTADSQRAALRCRAPETIVRAARVILDEPSPLAAMAFAAGAHCGMTRPMVREGLENLLGGLSVPMLRDLQSRAAAATRGEVVFHVLSGNLFLPGMESMILASVRGAVSLVRPSAADPFFPRLWAEALRIADADFARSVVVADWPQSAGALFDAAISEADIVVVYGGDTAVTSLAGRARPDQRFLGHGTRYSFAVVDASVLTPAAASDAAQRVAYDISVYDQQGCLSPRSVFVAATGEVKPCEFAAMLAREMALLARRLPRHDLTLEESAAIARERDLAWLDAALGGGRTVLSPPEAPFLVTLGSRRAGVLGATNRHADMQPFVHPVEVADALKPFAGAVSTVGIAGSVASWQTVLRNIGVARFCPVGEMQKPPPGCCHDGVTPLIDVEGRR